MSRRTLATAVAVVLLAAATLTYRASVLGREINLSAFDPLVAIAGAVALAMLADGRGRERFGRTEALWLGIGALAAAVPVLHTLFIAADYAPDPGGLLRETAKVAAAPTMVVATALVFRALGPDRIAAMPIAVTGVLLGLFGVFPSLAAATDVQVQTATLYAAAAVAGAFMALGLLARQRPPGWSGRAICLLGAAGGAALLLLSKAFFILSGAGIAAVIVRRGAPHGVRRWWVAPVAIAAGIAAAVIPMMLLVLKYEWDEILPITPVRESAGIRLDIWRLAIGLGIDAFPAGIGLGQFAPVAGERLTAIHQTLGFIHSVPVALFVEMGLAGILFALGVAAFVARVAIGWTSPLALAFALCLGLPMLLHDALSFRALVLLAGWLLAITAEQKEET